MPDDWPRVPLGDVLRKSADWIAIDPAATYSEVTVRLWGKGVTLRQQVSGAEIAGGSRLRVRPRQFIASRIDARNGAFGLIPDHLDGAVVTNDFPVFVPDETRLVPEFLNWMSKTAGFVDLCKRASEGTTNRVRLKEDKFLATAIPLPPVAEQRRVVARVDAVAARVADARRLRDEASAEYDSLLIALAHRGDLTAEQKQQRGWQQVRLGEVLRQVESTVRVRTDESYPNLGIYSFGRGLFEKQPIDGLATSAKTLNCVRAGQFIYSRLFAFEGAYGRVPAALDGRFVSNEYPTFDCDPDRLRPEFIDAYFRSKSVWLDVAAGSKGLGDRRQRVQPEQVLKYAIWLPPVADQQRLVAVEAKADALRALQARAAVELEALMPAVLARAFAGEL